MPKGVIVTHANLVANAAAFLGPAGLNRRPDDIAITWLPLFHDMGLIGFVLGTISARHPDRAVADRIVRAAADDVDAGDERLRRHDHVRAQLRVRAGDQALARQAISKAST